MLALETRYISEQLGGAPMQWSYAWEREISIVYLFCKKACTYYCIQNITMYEIHAMHGFASHSSMSPIYYCYKQVCNLLKEYEHNQLDVT